MTDNISGQTSSFASEVVRKAFAASSNYENVRQGYPEDAVRFFLQNLRLLDDSTACKKKVLELGSGTGKFTRVMLGTVNKQNVTVIASDPLEEMCKEFKHHQPDTEIIQCAAERIDLLDASIDVVIASQCFHWFANSAALEEIHRVLVNDGFFGMIWAIPDLSVPWMARLWEFLAPLYKEKSIVLPFDEKWADVFSSTRRRLFSDLEGNLDFRLNFPTKGFDEAYQFFASVSVIASANESTKRSFQQLFYKVMREEFEDKGVNFEQVPFKIYLYWCNKINQQN
ncbi:uncharacterized methyltransferase-like C25B8.10 [Acropora millepora]|uniref:uncharacterized methyltransferase-like C25B8.10 n=1 Tax=Acropora millepora TaxID=45264 RepID=UPI001CF21CD2|nr:uncharacterized methyltransferase-like C25B8.10 [Acropora millepora]